MMYKKSFIVLGSLFTLCQAFVPELAPLDLVPSASYEAVDQHKTPFTAVQNFSGCKKVDTFPTQNDCYNRLTWSGLAPAGAPNIAMRTFFTQLSYQIYRVNPADSTLELIATVPASGILQYDDHNRNPNINYTYYIFVVGLFGDISEPAVTTVTVCC